MLNRNKLDWAAGYFQSLALQMDFFTLSLFEALNCCYWLTTWKQTNHFSFDQKIEYFFRCYLWRSPLLYRCRQQQFVRFFFVFKLTPNKKSTLAIFWKFLFEYKWKKKACEKHQNKQQWAQQCRLICFCIFVTM